MAVISLGNDDIDVVILTCKEGLLSRVAHDLKIVPTRFTVEVDPEQRRVSASFDSDSLSVVCAREKGEDAPAVLSESDKAKIAETIRRDVLDAKRFARITFEGTARDPGDGTWQVGGTLNLHGTKKDIRAALQRRGRCLDGHRAPSSARLRHPAVFRYVRRAQTQDGRGRECTCETFGHARPPLSITCQQYDHDRACLRVNHVHAASR